MNFIHLAQVRCFCYVRKNFVVKSIHGHIAKPVCICYNADRQNVANSPRWTTKNPGGDAPGFFCSQFWQWQGLRP